MKTSLSAIRLTRILSLICCMAIPVATDADEISLWPEGKVPIPEANQAAKVPGPEQVEVRDTEENTNRWITGTRVPTLTVHLPAEQSRTGSAVVICPGGGYGGLAFDKEGIDVGKWCAARGMAAFTLKYRHGGGAHVHPVPLMDVQRALRLVRSRAEQWNLESDRMGIFGFSAGGHLAASAATLSDDGDTASPDPIERQGSRAHFAILAYPVISMESNITHAGSRSNLLGDKADQRLVEQMSLDRNVTASSPPTFLVHAGDDEAVPIENSLRYYKALQSQGVSAELHAYEQGGHGFGMLQRGLPIDHWPAALEAWLKSRQLIR